MENVDYGKKNCTWISKTFGTKLNLTTPIKEVVKYSMPIFLFSQKLIPIHITHILTWDLLLKEIVDLASHEEHELGSGSNSATVLTSHRIFLNFCFLNHKMKKK